MLETSTQRRRRRPLVLLVALLAVACTSTPPPAPPGSTGSPASSAGPSPTAPTAPTATSSSASLPPTEAPSPSPTGPSPVPSPTASPSPSASPSAPPVDPATSTISYGEDGRLTVLLLGSDQRANYRGERTDVMIVASIDPNTKRISLAGISRDATSFPLAPSNGGGTTGARKVNSQYVLYKRPRFRAEEAIDPRAIGRFRDDIAYALGIEIDYHAFIRFTGFAALVDHVGGLRVDIAQPIWDPVFGASGIGPRGIFFPAARRFLLAGNPPCRGIPYVAEYFCRSALVYARTRKGSVGADRNSTVYRGRRNQQLVMAAIRRVLQRGDGASLMALRAATEGHIVTDLPRTPSDALRLFQLLDGAQARSEDRAVFWPPDFGSDGRDAAGRAVDVLDFERIRAWADVHLGPVP